MHPPATQAARPMGLLVAGQVKNYVPVTDEMLRNPDPGDWLMIRRNYQAHSYSPLDSITTANVKDLRLEWVWAMNDGGANEPTPIVHNGIIYLANTSNTVQALDGRTGDLIWENHIGPGATRAYGATRSLGIYQDKVFIATTDAQLYALDARTGKIVWQTAHRRSEEGLQQHQWAARHPRQSRAGPDGLRAVPARGLLHQRLRCGDRQAALEVPHRAHAARPGRRYLGHASGPMRAGGETWITGSYDPDLQRHILGRRAGEAVDAGQPRRQSRRQGALHQLDCRAQSRRSANSPGISSTCPANRWISTKCSSACWSTAAARS